MPAGSAASGTGTLAVELLIPQVNAKAFADAVELGDHVGQLLDGLDLLAEVLALQKVGHLRVVVAVGNLVQVQQRLVDI